MYETETAQAVDGRIEMMREFVDLDQRRHSLLADREAVESELKAVAKARQEIARRICETVEPSQKPSPDFGATTINTAGGY